MNNLNLTLKNAYWIISEKLAAILKIQLMESNNVNGKFNIIFIHKRE